MPVDLDYSESSNIDHAEYDEETKVMTVFFLSGSVYEYANVPKRQWGNYVAAPSKGRFFYHFIRTTYQYKRIYSPQGAGNVGPTDYTAKAIGLEYELWELDDSAYLMRTDIDAASIHLMQCKAAERTHRIMPKLYSF